MLPELQLGAYWISLLGKLLTGEGGSRDSFRWLPWWRSGLIGKFLTLTMPRVACDSWPPPNRELQPSVVPPLVLELVLTHGLLQTLSCHVLCVAHV